MNKCKDILVARRKFIKESIRKAPSTVKEIARLSKKLFLSESTIYKDLKSNCKDGNPAGQ